MSIINLAPTALVSNLVQEALRAQCYEAVLDILGVTGTIIPIGDAKHTPTVTTLVTVGAEQVTFTYSKDPNTFDNPPGLKGIIQTMTFDGVDEEADSPDAAFWSRVAGAFTVGAWVNFNTTLFNTILAKFDDAGNTREWVFQILNDDKLRLILYDESVGSNPTIDTTSDVAVTASAWKFVVATYDGTADASGINLFVDGLGVASSDTDDVNFVNLEDLGGTMKLAHLAATPANLFSGSMGGGPLGPFMVPAVLSNDAILRLFEVGRRSLGL